MTVMSLDDLQAESQVTFFDYQAAALAAAQAQEGPSQRLCLYYKTGAGKSLTALACVRLWGHRDVLVVAPPSTHTQWEVFGRQLGVTVEAMSHAKFRQSGTLLSRTKAIIADEMHLFGGQQGQGWRKLSRLARSLQAPLVLASATPNYNDAERVYCIQHILDPAATKGGFLAFLYQHCVTEQNPFSQTPKVVGFQRFASAADYLAALPKVQYLPDDLVYTVVDVSVPVCIPSELDTFGLNMRAGRMVASLMEDRHARVNLAFTTDAGRLHDQVYAEVKALVVTSPTPVLVFATHATIAEALGVSLTRDRMRHAVIHGGLTSKVKQRRLELFIQGEYDVLVGTAALATGTDGMDKVCDRLVILDDTDDDSLRRQLIGRIMPRGSDSGMPHTKEVYRFVLQEASSTP